MKTTILILAALGLAFSSLHAQTVPPYINYQGKVTDSIGLPIGATGTPAAPVAAPTNRKVIFRIWDHASSTAPANRLWTEEQTVTISVGEFSVLLGLGINATGTAAGESRPALDTVFTGIAGSGVDRYLSILVDNGDGAINGSDTEISPRQRITTTAFSFRARSADTITSGNDLQLNGSTDFGLGYYGTGGGTGHTTFGGSTANGPVLFGLGGGALGSSNGAAKAIALQWDASSNITIGGSVRSTNGYFFNPDTDTGMVSGGDGLIDFKTNGGFVMRMNAAGNVGIGTTTPGFPLTFANTLGDKISLFGQSGNSWGFGIQGSQLQIHSDTNGGDITFGYGSSASMVETMRIKGNGNVGIGTTVPAAALSVGNGSLSDGTVSIQTSTIGAGTEKYIGINKDGNYGLLVGYRGNAGLIRQVTSDPLQFWVNNLTQAMTILSDGSVGIGAATPSTKLEVSGTVKATAFSGDGSGLTTLNASNISSGTLNAARLPAANIAFTSVSNSFTGSQYISSKEPLIKGRLALRPSVGMISTTGLEYRWKC